MTRDNTQLSTKAMRTVAASTAAIALVTIPNVGAFADETHRVSSGETVSSIAREYGTSINAIVAANNLDSHARIFAGQDLVIPVPATKTASNAARTESVRHTTAQGDTVWGLASKYRVSVNSIIKANGLNSSGFIRIGQVLDIPAASSSSSAPAASSSTSNSSAGVTSHRVVAGDTLSSIARKYGTTSAAIQRQNSLANPNFIRIGQVLQVPGASGSTTNSSPQTSGKLTLARPENLHLFSNIPTGLVGSSFLGRTYRDDVVRAANVNKATLNAIDVPTRAQMQELITRTARDMGVDPALALAIAYQESGFNMRSVSPANAIGVMQVIPTSGDWASDLVGRELNLLIPEDNVVAGIAILRQLQRNGTDLDTAIAGYYQGETSVRKYGMASDTKDYVKSVRALMKRFS